MKKKKKEYLIKLIDIEINRKNNFVVYMQKWMKDNNKTDSYTEKQIILNTKKIAFANEVKSEIEKLI